MQSILSSTETIRQRLLEGFNEKQASLLAEIVFYAYQDLVKTSDFNELKAIVKDLADAQKRTEQKVEELADAQKRTEEEVRSLAIGLKETRGDLGGLSRSFGYALENEAYRMLPKVMKEKYGIEIQEKLIRTEIGDKEINILGRASKNGSEIIIVGESKSRLDHRKSKNRKSIFDELDEKVDAVRKEYGNIEIAQVIITHFASKVILQEAEKKGVFIIQSFDW